jgi:hypothetical protein
VRLSLSRTFPFVRRRRYFCSEPWTGIFSVEVNQDVVFCPCYLKLTIGNLNERPLPEIWNAPMLRRLRRTFRRGGLPKPCRKQLCPVVRGGPT